MEVVVIFVCVSASWPMHQAGQVAVSGVCSSLRSSGVAMGFPSSTFGMR